MAFFESDIVQDEAKRLFGDYQQLMQLGSEYGKFDRESKKKFIETMEELMVRYRVFMKRFELSEDFQAKLTDTSPSGPAPHAGTARNFCMRVLFETLRQLYPMLRV